MLSLFRKQPPAFGMVFMLEIWERFGYYTVQGIITLYFVKWLGYSETTAYYTFGAFFALVYGMVAIGGFLGDKVLGTKRTIVLGLITLACGYLALSLVNKKGVFYALGLICVGNGLFKANPSSLLARCYDEQDPRLHGGFTLYYMAINVGSIFALLIAPTLASRYGYSYAFFMSFIGIMLGLVNYALQYTCVSHINTLADERHIAWWQWGMVVLGIVVAAWISAYLLHHVAVARALLLVVVFLVISIYFIYMVQEKSVHFNRMLLAFILMLEALVFFTLYQQMPTSLTLFAVHNVRSTFAGISINPQSWQVLNPIWIVINSPLVAILYLKLERRGILFLIPYKFALGMTLCGVSFMVLFFSRYVHDSFGMVSSWWLVASYFVQSLSEILVSALGVAMVAELVPRRIVGFVMGMWFIISSLAGFTGAKVASYTALPTDISGGYASLASYTQIFAYIGMVTLAIALVLWLISPRLSRLMQAHLA